MRRHSSELPTYYELCGILAHEARRLISKEKANLHFGDFETFARLIEVFGLSNRFLDASLLFEDWKYADVLSEIEKMFNELVVNILRTKDDSNMQKLFNNLYDYLAESDELEKADLIFVFGSKGRFRIDKAIELFREGFAPKILISGKAPFYERDTALVTEAETLASYARGQGILDDVLILEKESITVPDNVKRSLNLLEKEQIPHSKIIIVNSPFSERRGWAHWSKMSDVGTKLIRCNSDCSETYSRDGWYKNETGARMIVKEFFGLRVSEMINTS